MQKSWESGPWINVLSYVLVHSQLSSQHRHEINLMVNKVNINGTSLLHAPTTTERNKHIIIIKIFFFTKVTNICFGLVAVNTSVSLVRWQQSVQTLAWWVGSCLLASSGLCTGTAPRWYHRCHEIANGDTFFLSLPAEPSCLRTCTDFLFDRPRSSIGPFWCTVWWHSERSTRQWVRYRCVVCEACSNTAPDMCLWAKIV